MELRTIETDTGPAVELSDGVAGLAIAADRIPDLVRGLREAAEGEGLSGY